MSYSIIELEMKRRLVSLGEFCSWLLYEEQMRIRDEYLSSLDDNTYDIIMATFCRKSGKTFTAMAICIEECIKKPGFNAFAIAPTREQIGMYIKPVLNELINFLPKELRPIKNGNQWVFKHHNPNDPTKWATIHLAGADFKQGDGLRGPKANLIILDEAAFVKVDLEYLVNSILMPMLQGAYGQDENGEEKDGKLFIISTPPRSMAHKYVMFASRAERLGKHIVRTIYEVTRYARDPRKIEKIIRQNGGKNSIAFRREYMCEMVTDNDARIIPEFSPEWHPSKMSEMPPVPEYYQPYTVIDWGFRHNTGILMGYLDFERHKFVVQSELFLKAKSTGQIADEIKKREKELWGQFLNSPQGRGVSVKRVGDNNPQLCHDITKDHGLHVVPVKKTGLDRTVRALRDVINSKYVISPEVRSLRFQLINGIWDKDRKNFEEINMPMFDEELDGVENDFDVLGGEGQIVSHCDQIAALMYLNRFVNWNKNPNPAITIDIEKERRIGGPIIKPKDRGNTIYKGSIFKVKRY